MKFIYNDGGREKAGYKGKAGDCVTRAIAIVMQLPYEEVYNSLHKLIYNYSLEHNDKVSKRIISRGSRGLTPRNGISKPVFHPWLILNGFMWKPCMAIGSGCKVHLKDGELPGGRILARVSKHLVAVIDGVINDIHDCSRGGTRCVYGYYYIK